MKHRHAYRFPSSNDDLIVQRPPGERLSTLILGAKVPAAAHGLKVSVRVAGVLVAAGMDAGGGEGTVMARAGAVAGAVVAVDVMIAGPVPAAGVRAVVHPEARSATTPAAASVTRLATAGRLRRTARSSSSFRVSPSSGSVIVDAADPPAVAMAQLRPPRVSEVQPGQITRPDSVVPCKPAIPGPKTRLTRDRSPRPGRAEVATTPNAPDRRGAGRR